jgi:acyl-CoA-dependent ceramide synthase
MYNSKYWLALEYIWADWPDREMDKLVKWYYLVQFAFWLQQIVVVNIEERRKDYSQMFTHHVVTSALMFTSYGYHHYRIGNVIMCLMDAVDMILPVSRMRSSSRHL